MRTFVHRTIASRPSESDRTSHAGRAHSGQRLAVNYRLNLKRSTGNQSVQRLLKAKTENPEAGSANSATIGAFHDISRVPVHSNTPGNIQPKPKVNAPGDLYEQAADHRGTQVMKIGDLSTPEPAAREMSPGEKEVDVQSEPLAASSTPLVQREMMPEGDEDLIQTKLSLMGAEKGGTFEPGNWLEARLSSSKGGGRPLRDEVRTFMEPRFGADFGRVRVHADSGAAQMNRALNAQAFTCGQDIYFGANMSAVKDRLTAHELTHVLQQTGGARSQETGHVPGIQREVQVRPPGPGEASAFDRRQELIDRLNALSRGLAYRLDDRVIRYNVIDNTALTPFDRQMQGFIDRAEVVPMRLITGAGYVRGAGGTFEPLSLDSYVQGYLDLDDLLASDDFGFQARLIHVLTERFATRNYERRVGTTFTLAEFNPAHRAAHEAEAQLFRDVIGDPTIRFLYAEARPNGTWVVGFRSDEGYRIFRVVRGAGREVRGAVVWVRTSDGRRLTVDQLRAERAAAAAPAAAAP